MAFNVARVRFSPRVLGVESPTANFVTILNDLSVALKAVRESGSFDALVQSLLCHMPKWGMPKIMGQRSGFGHVWIRSYYEISTLS